MVKSVIPANQLLQEKFDVCRTCRRQFTEGRFPGTMIVNNMKMDECPDELKSLNWIEYSLIQIIRPVKNMCNLTDTGGRKTTVAGTWGAMVLLPVPIDSTITYVANTLPSAANLVIVVDSVYGAKLVSLPRVIKALNWLKKNK